MNKTTCALAALGLLVGVACQGENPPSQSTTPTQTQNLEVSDPTTAQPVTLAVSGMV